MTRERIACVGFCVLATASVAAAQQSSGPTEPGPASRITEHRYAAGNIEGWRATHTRNTSSDREVIVDAIERPNVDGRMARSQETVRETRRSGPNTTETRRDLYGFGVDGRRSLLETTQSQQQTLGNGDTSAVHDTVTPDLNGHTGLTSRQVDRTRPTGPDGRETDTTFLSPHYNDGLREAARDLYTESRSGGSVRYDSTHQIRDVNDRWQASEMRAGEIQDSGASERSQEETIQRLDMNGKLAVAERTVTRRSTTTEREDVVIERYAPYVDRLLGADRGLALSERVHRTTTTRADGGSDILEEVEGRNPVALTEPMRLVRRTVTSVRRSGADQWLTQRQVYERDVNGRLQVVGTETESSSEK